MKFTPGLPTEITGEYARFKVFPAPDRPEYWVVLIFPTKTGMRRAFHTLNTTGDKDDRFGAIVMPLEVQKLVKGRWKTVGHSLGHVLLSRSQLNMETQCHESLHMALGFLRRLKMTPSLKRETDGEEEILAYYTGRCAAQLNCGLHKTKSYKV